MSLEVGYFKLIFRGFKTVQDFPKKDNDLFLVDTLSDVTVGGHSTSFKFWEVFENFVFEKIIVSNFKMHYLLKYLTLDLHASVTYRNISLNLLYIKDWASLP